MPARLLDTNVLIHAAFRKARFYAEAREILDRALAERSRYCLAPQNLVEFSAVVTRKKLVGEAMPGSDVVRFVSVLYQSRNLKKIYPKRATVMRAVREGAALGIQGPLWYDLFLAVTMRDLGLSEIVTEDTNDFRQFPFVTALSIEEEARNLRGQP